MHRPLSLAVLVLFFTASLHAAPWEFAGWEGGGCYPNAAYDPTNPNRVYLASDVAGVWRSEDGGDHWQFATKGLPHLNIAAIVPVDQKTVFAASARGLFRSDDAGENWRTCGGRSAKFSFRRPDSYRPLVVEPHAGDFRIVAATADGLIQESLDGCQHWNSLSKSPFKKGEPITAILRSHSGALIAAGSSGVYRYDSAARKWQALPSAPKHVTDLALSDPRMIAAHAGGLSAYSEESAQWNKLPAPAGGVYRVAAAGTRLWAAVNKGWSGSIWKSDDQGQTWQRTDSAMQSDAAANPTRAWAAVHGRVTSLVVSSREPSAPVIWTDWWGVWRSRDEGVSWQEIIQGAPNTVTTDIYVDPQSRVWAASMDNGLLVSEDAGRSYRAAFPKAGYDAGIQGHVWRVAGTPSGRIVAASSPWNANFNQAALSDDGVHFKRTQKGLPSHRPKKNTVWEFGYPRALAVHPVHPERMYMGVDGDDGGGLYLSRDSGETWQPSPAQPFSRRVYRGLAVDPKDPEWIYWGAFDKRKGGVYRSQDGGKKWKRVFFSSRMILDVVTSPDGRVFASSEEGRVYRSTDRGSTWQKIGDFSRFGTAAALAWVGGTDGRLAVGCMQWHGYPGGGVFLSDPALKKWENLSDGLPGGNGVSAIAYDSVRRELYAARFGNSIYKKSLENSF